MALSYSFPSMLTRLCSCDSMSAGSLKHLHLIVSALSGHTGLFFSPQRLPVRCHALFVFNPGDLHLRKVVFAVWKLLSNDYLKAFKDTWQTSRRTAGKPITAVRVPVRRFLSKHEWPSTFHPPQAPLLFLVLINPPCHQPHSARPLGESACGPWDFKIAHDATGVTQQTRLISMLSV